MKFIHYVPPLLALTIAAAWLTHLRGSNSALDQNNRALQEKIAESRNSSVVQNERARAGAESAKAKSEEKPSELKIKPTADWVSASRDCNELVLFNNNEANYRYTAAWARLEKLASEMSGEELARAYTEMTTLPVHAPFRDDLEWVMLKKLEKKNPEFAFSQYIAKYQSEDRAPARIGKFNEWLARDPAAATSWYESQLATGVFDKDLGGKSPIMLPFESAFIMSLLASDPSAAEQRMNNIPPDLRGGLGGYLWDVPKENGEAFVELLRKTMPMEEYMGILRKNSLTEYNFSLSSDKDPKSVQKNLESLGVTPEERSTLMVQHFTELAQYRAMRDKGNTPSREKFDDFRKWIQAIDPFSADRATGFALQSYLEKSKTAGAQAFVEKIAVDYHGSGAGDELLIPLIEGSANGSVVFPKDRARVLATMISDGRLREELLQKLN
jgi:hypothetical protein